MEDSRLALQFPLITVPISDCSMSASAEKIIGPTLALSYLWEWSFSFTVKQRTTNSFWLPTRSFPSFWGWEWLIFLTSVNTGGKHVCISVVMVSNVKKLASSYKKGSLMLLVWEPNVNTSPLLWALWWNTCMAEGSPLPDGQSYWTCTFWGGRPCWQCWQTSTRSLYRKLCWISTPEGQKTENWPLLLMQ